MTNEEIVSAINETKWISEENFHKLCDYARLVPENGSILEIGSGPGTAICAMAMAAKESVRLYGIDPEIPKRPHRGIIERVKDAKLEGKVFLVIGDSQKVAKRWKLQVDLLFCDGVHSYEAVLKDTRAYQKFLKKNGHILWHDYELYRNTVGKAVDEFIRSGRDYEKIFAESNICIARRLNG